MKPWTRYLLYLTQRPPYDGRQAHEQKVKRINEVHDGTSRVILRRNLGRRSEHRRTRNRREERAKGHEKQDDSYGLVLAFSLQKRNRAAILFDEAC